MLTKQGMTLWSTAASGGSWTFVDTTEAVRAATPAHPIVAEPPAGPATIVSYTVLYDSMEPSRGVAIVDTDLGRTIVETTDAATMQAMLREEWCGREIVVGEVFS